MDLNLDDKDYLHAMEHYLSGMWKDAEEDLSRLLGRFPDDTFILLLLGNTYYSLGELDRAAEVYEHAIQVNPEFGVASYKLGVCYYRSGKLVQALESFQNCMDLKGGSHAMASYFVGLISLFLGDDKRAVEGFDLLRAESGESKIANYYLAQLKIKQQNFREAAELLSELLEVTPNFAEVHYLLGIANLNLHENTKAIQYFRKALELDPNDKRSRSRLEFLTGVEWP